MVIMQMLIYYSILCYIIQLRTNLLLESLTWNTPIRPDVPQRRRIVIEVRVQKRSAGHRSTAAAAAATAARAAARQRCTAAAARSGPTAAASATLQRQPQTCLELLAARLATRAGAVHIGDATVGRTGWQ